MQSISQLRHSIRTALNHIIGYSEMLGDEMRSPAPGGSARLEGLAAQARALSEHIRPLLAGPEQQDGRAAMRKELVSLAGSILATLPAVAEAAPDYAGDLAKIEAAACELQTLARDLLSASAEMTMDDDQPQASFRPARILVVDDNAANREILCRQLERQGYVAEEAGGGPEALTRARAQAFDLILLDIVMPGMDGFEVLRAICSDSRLTFIPVVMLSALDEMESVARCVEMGAADFVSKPLDPRLLRARIESILSRRRAEIERAKMAESFRLLLESTAEGIFGVDEHGRCTFINAAGSKALGYERDQLLGARMHDLIHPATSEPGSHPAGACPMEQAARSGRFSRVPDDRFFCENGAAVPVEYSANPIFQDGEVRGAVITFSDVSERKGAEEHMRQTAKLESLGILAGGIAHDFNNLLTGVLGNASLLYSGFDTRDPRREFAQQIITASEKAAELTAQMLAYAGKSPFVTRPVHLCDLVRGVTALIHSSIPRTAMVELRCDEELVIDGDPTQIQQVIMNLVINAGEALDDGKGSVIISAGIREADTAQPAEPEPLPPGRYVVLEVKDTGAGMSAEVRNRIFDPFFSTKFLGRGLGLAASLGIIRAHKGGVTVESGPGEGSTFRVYFPASETSLPVRNTKPQLAAAQRGFETILVVDDEDTVRRTATRALEGYGYTVLCAPGGREAIALLRKHHQAVSLVLLDMSMPGMSGAEAVRYLRAIQPGIPILATSGYDEDEMTRQFVPHGITAFIRKPYRAEQLVNAVARLLQHDRATLAESLL